MEPTEKQVVVIWHTQLTAMNFTPRSFVLESPYGTWVTPEPHGLAPGDRVKITITKEPFIAQPE